MSGTIGSAVLDIDVAVGIDAVEQTSGGPALVRAYVTEAVGGFAVGKYVRSLYAAVGDEGVPVAVAYAVLEKAKLAF